MTSLTRLRADGPLIATVSLILVGSLVRLRQYAVNRSLWVDEAALALNIIRKSMSELARPLDYLQGAPPGFLWATKLATLLGSETEPWLRLVPLLLSLAALVTFPFIARHYLSKWAVVLALALLVLSERLIYYASEVKQYSADVLATILVLGLFAHFRDRRLTPATTLLVAGAGALLVWFSQPSIFVLAGVGLTWLALVWRTGDRRQVYYLIVSGLCWLGSFAFVALLSFGRLVDNPALAQFWAAAGFPPPLAAGLEVPSWYLQKLLELVSRPLGLTLAGLGLLMGLVGVVSFYQRDRVWLATLVLPITLAMLAAILRVYPFADRLLLFTAPLTAILIAEGTERSGRSLNTVAPRLGWLLLFLILFAPVVQTTRSLIVPAYGEELRPVLAYVRQQWQPGDTVYVYHGAAAPFDFYRDGFGFNEEEVTTGVQSRFDWEPYFNEMDELAGTSGRVWMVFLHVYRDGGTSEESLLVNYLNHLGTVHSDVFRAPGAAAYLYDFSPLPP